MSAKEKGGLQRLIEEAKQEADEAWRRADEAQRLLDEARRERIETENLTDELEKLTDEAMEASKRFRMYCADSQRKFDSFKGWTSEPQSLRNYLNQVRHLLLYTSRLLPLHHETSELSSLDADKNCNVATDTSVQTSINRKFYPLRVRPWTEFPQEHRKVFSALQEQLQDSHVFLTGLEVESLEILIDQDIPVAFLRSDRFLSHGRTSVVLDGVIEKPCSRILAEHYKVNGQKKAVFFENKRSNKEPILDSDANTPYDLSDDDIYASDTADAFDTAAQKLPGKAIPDCVIWIKDLDTDCPGSRERPYILAIGEHKPCHSIRAKDLENNPTLPEDCLIRMAIASKGQLGKEGKDQTAGHQQSDSTVLSPSDSAVGPPDIPQKLQVFASALAQTYHFMITSGLEYGYLATGETLTFLRVPLEDPTTLLYHTSLFPAVDPTDLPKLHGHPVYPTRVTAREFLEDLPDIGDDLLGEQAVSQLSSLTIMASKSTARSVAWVNETLGLLAEFPNLPKGHGDVMASSLDSRSHKDIDSAGDGNSGSCKLPYHPPMHRVDESGDLAASPLRQTQQAPRDTTQDNRASGDCQADLVAAGIKAVKEDKMLPYCTQACLLGLVRGLPFDTSCPNYDIHKNALPQPSSAEPQVEGQKHGISKADVCRLIREQIAVHPENNCDFLYNGGLYGNTRYMFKLSINGYGYTFAAKGVESHHLCRLKRETHIYKHLQRLQGVLTPVHLGLVKLRSPYPFMAKFTTISHLMLISYTGYSLYYESSLDDLSQELGRNLEQEISDVSQELEGWGLFCEDEDVCNTTWCEEKQRVMVDLHRCFLNMYVYKKKLKAVESSLKSPGASNKRVMVDDPERGQTGDNGAASVTDMQPVSKRSKHEDE